MAMFLSIFCFACLLVILGQIFESNHLRRVVRELENGRDPEAEQDETSLVQLQLDRAKAMNDQLWKRFITDGFIIAQLRQANLKLKQHLSGKPEVTNN